MTAYFDDTHSAPASSSYILPTYLKYTKYGSKFQHDLRRNRILSSLPIKQSTSIISDPKYVNLLGKVPSLYLNKTNQSYLDYIVQMSRLSESSNNDELEKQAHDQQQPHTQSSECEDDNEEPTDTSSTAVTSIPSNLDGIMRYVPKTWESPGLNDVQFSQDLLSVSTRYLNPTGRYYLGASLELKAKECHSIRTNVPAYSFWGMYYFEITVTFSSKQNADVIVGFMTGKKASQDEVAADLREKENYSIGYRGEDGKILSKSSNIFLPTFGPGDTIGCGFINSMGDIFFTKNGSFLGLLPHEGDAIDRRYPVVTMAIMNTVRANFGLDPSVPFVFDIDNFSLKRKSQVLSSLISIDQPNNSPKGNFQSDMGSISKEFVRSYLAKEGYTDTLRIMGLGTLKEVYGGDRRNLMILKKRIRELINQDNVDSVVQLLNKTYSQALEENKHVGNSLQLLKMMLLMKNLKIDDALKLGKRFRNIDLEQRSQLNSILHFLTFDGYEHSVKFQRTLILQKKVVLSKLSMLLDELSKLSKDTCIDELISHNDPVSETDDFTDSQDMMLFFSSTDDFIQF